MSAEIATVIHVADAPYESADGHGQWCLDCDFLLWHPGSDAHPVPKPWQRGDLVAVRIDETPKDGYIVGFWKVDPKKALEADERRCTVRE